MGRSLLILNFRETSFVGSVSSISISFFCSQRLPLDSAEISFIYLTSECAKDIFVDSMKKTQSNRVSKVQRISARRRYNVFEKTSRKRWFRDEDKISIVPRMKIDWIIKNWPCKKFIYLWCFQTRSFYFPILHWLLRKYKILHSFPNLMNPVENCNSEL